MRERRDGKVTRTWIVRLYEGKRDWRKNLGRAGKTSWSRARAEAARLYDESQSNIASDVIIPTFGEAYKRYCTKRSAKWSPVTTEGYAKKYGYLAPTWETRRVDRITEDDVDVLFREIQELVRRNAKKGVEIRPGVRLKVAINRDGRSTAVAALRLAKIIFNYLKVRGVIKSNPCQGMIDDGIFDDWTPRSRSITAHQLPLFWSWLHGRTNDPRHIFPLPCVRDYILIELFTGFRRSIMGALCWSNIIMSRDNQMFYMLRADAPGNKAKVDIAHPIPDFLVSRVIEPRRGLHKEWILPSPKFPDEPLRNIRGSLKRLAKDTGIVISDHDFRRTIATITRQAVGDLMAARILTHRVDAPTIQLDTTAGYVITTPDDLRAGMNRVVDYVMKIVTAPALTGPLVDQ